MRFSAITDIFPVNSVGIVTGRDSLTIEWTPDEVWQTVSRFANMDPEAARSAYRLGRDAHDWKVTLAQDDLRQSGPNPNLIKKILYRPFDTRYTYYTGRSSGFLCRPRQEVMKHMMEGNVALIFHRREELGVPYRHFLVTNVIAEHCCISIKTISYLAPLYLYENQSANLHASSPEAQSKKANISPAVLSKISGLYGKSVSPEDIFHYVYAVAHSNEYRTRYKELLKRDFPRIPFVKDYDTFSVLAKIGKELVDLHLQKKGLVTHTKFDVQGSNVVKFVRYNHDNLFINAEQYFGGIPEEVWEFRIGAYKVLDKWLKSRKGRDLSGDDVKQFLQIVEIIRMTLDCMRRIDMTRFLRNI